MGCMYHLWEKEGFQRVPKIVNCHILWTKMGRERVPSRRAGIWKSPSAVCLQLVSRPVQPTKCSRSEMTAPQSKCSLPYVSSSYRGLSSRPSVADRRWRRPWVSNLLNDKNYIQNATLKKATLLSEWHPEVSLPHVQTTPADERSYSTLGPVSA